MFSVVYTLQQIILLFQTQPMTAFFNNVKSFFASVFSRSKKIVVAPPVEDEYDGMLGV